MTDKTRILVIKHGALGDFIMSCGPFAAIRAQHAACHITLLTTKPYVQLAQASGYFDEVWTDEKPKLIDVGKFWDLITKLRGAGFAMVYDLQTSGRTDWYFRLMGRKKPLWSGRIEWCSHPHNNPERTKMHTIERQAEQLKIAGIAETPRPDISWLKSDIAKFNLTKSYALMVAGGSAHRLEKRWSQSGYVELAKYFWNKGITPVFLGTQAEEEEINGIISLCGDAVSLTNQTSFADIAELARGAVVAVGNDTGPMHIISFTDCPSVVLFSEASNPDKVRPRGKNTRVLFDEDLEYLPAKDVISMVEELVKE